VIFNQPKYTRFSLVANFFTKMHILHIERIEIVIFYFFKNIFFLERIFTISMRYVQFLVAYAPPMKIEQILAD
jgi:hypothetical protein